MKKSLAIGMAAAVVLAIAGMFAWAEDVVRPAGTMPEATPGATVALVAKCLRLVMDYLDQSYYNTSSCYSCRRRAVGRLEVRRDGLEGIVRLALAFLACCFALNQGVARGAEIKATPIPGLLDTAMITLSGEIESSDAEQFRAAVAIYPKAIVAFQSPGGNLIAGIEIGTQIRLRSYLTLVPTGVQYASACALAWLGGTKRLMGPEALIGFLQKPVNRPGLDARRFGHALRRPARGGAKQQSHAFGCENLEDRFDDRRFSDARPAGDHEHLRHQRQSDCGSLTISKLQPATRFDPGQGLLFVNPWPGQLAVGDADQPLGDCSLGPIEAGQERERSQNSRNI